MQTKLKYSKKVRALGYGIVALEVLTVFLWLAAWYGNSLVLVSIARSASGIAGGQALNFQNSTSAKALTIPVTGAGLFPVTVNISVTALDSQNKTIAQVQSGVTVSPGETKALTLSMPSSLVSSISSSSSPSGYRIYVGFQTSSLFNLVGAKAEISINPKAIIGSGAS